MDVQIFQLIEGASKASGLAIIIDVFRAFSVDCYLFQNGAAKIIPVGRIEDAYRLKEKNPGYILMGERKETIQPGFDFGNSPTQIMDVDFTGKTIVQSTSAGTQGIVNAEGADEVLTGSFVNAAAIIRHILQKRPEKVSLVAMGYAGHTPSDEDLMLAEYIKQSLEKAINSSRENAFYQHPEISFTYDNQQFDLQRMKSYLKKGSGKRFFLPENQEKSPESDFELCLTPNQVDFIIQANKAGAGFVLEKIKV